jgi:hypothetical protein
MVKKMAHLPSPTFFESLHRSQWRPTHLDPPKMRRKSRPKMKRKRMYRGILRLEGTENHPISALPSTLLF